ncbi:MAG: enoyl-CoA hydratase-related protein [Pseudomonadota bacterium]
MSRDHIKTHRDGNVLTVTIDNEPKRNAIGTDALDRLDSLADELPSSGVRAVILTGAGDRAFTSGFDLAELGDFKPENFLKSHFSDVFEKWARLPMPVIGALNGHCMGGGVHVAVICDTLISVPGARFMIPAARFGFVYVPASIRRIAAALGPTRAAELLYLNQELVADDLVAAGFIRKIATRDLMADAMDMAQNAAKLAPLSVAAMKEIVHDSPDQPRIEELVRSCAHSEDVIEGLAAMREKRQPIFKRR